MMGMQEKIYFDGAQTHLEDLKPEHLVFNQATPSVTRCRFVGLKVRGYHSCELLTQHVF